MDAHDQLLLSGGVCRQLHWLDDAYGIRDYSLGQAVQTTIIEPGAITEGATPDIAAQMQKVRVSASINWRRQRLAELIGDPELLSSDQKQQLLEYMDIHLIAFYQPVVHEACSQLDPRLVYVFCVCLSVCPHLSHL